MTIAKTYGRNYPTKEPILKSIVGVVTDTHIETRKLYFCPERKHYEDHKN